jgi:hypothetical protein
MDGCEGFDPGPDSVGRDMVEDEGGRTTVVESRGGRFVSEAVVVSGAPALEATVQNKTRQNEDFAGVLRNECRAE